VNSNHSNRNTQVPSSNFIISRNNSTGLERSNNHIHHGHDGTHQNETETNLEEEEEEQEDETEEQEEITPNKNSTRQYHSNFLKHFNENILSKLPQYILQTDPQIGLSESEAYSRRKLYGKF